MQTLSDERHWPQSDPVKCSLVHTNSSNLTTTHSTVKHSAGRRRLDGTAVCVLSGKKNVFIPVRRPVLVQQLLKWNFYLRIQLNRTREKEQDSNTEEGKMSKTGVCTLLSIAMAINWRMCHINHKACSRHLGHWFTSLAYGVRNRSISHGSIPLSLLLQLFYYLAKYNFLPSVFHREISPAFNKWLRRPHTFCESKPPCDWGGETVQERRHEGICDLWRQKVSWWATVWGVDVRMM